MKTLTITILLAILSFSPSASGGDFDILNWSEQREQTRLMEESITLQKETADRQRLENSNRESRERLENTQNARRLYGDPFDFGY